MFTLYVFLNNPINAINAINATNATNAINAINAINATNGFFSDISRLEPMIFEGRGIDRGEIKLQLMV